MTPRPSTKPRTDLLFVDLFFIALITACAAKFFFRADEMLDLVGGDEQDWLRFGTMWMTKGHPIPAQSSPLYSMWYAWLASLVGPVDALYWNLKILTTVFSVVVYLTCRAFASPGISLLFAFLALLSDINVPVWTKVGMPALLLPVTGWLVGRFVHSPYWSVLLSGIGIILAAYIRPEFTFMVPCLLVPLVLLFVKKKEAVRTMAIKASGVLASWTIVAGSLVVYFGVPTGGNRSWRAFSHHFLYNWVETNPVDGSIWLDTERIMFSIFPKANSILSAVAEHPWLVITHLIKNLLALPAEVFHGVFSHLPILVPTSLPKARALESALLFLLLAYLTFKKHERVRELGRNAVRFFSRPENFGLLAPLLLTTVTCLLIVPFPRHVVPFCFFAWVFLAATLEKGSSLSLPAIPRWSPLLLFLIMPVFNSSWNQRGEPTRPRLEIVKAIKRLSPNVTNAPMNVLTSDPRLVAYLGTNYEMINGGPPSFEERLKRNDLLFFIPRSPNEAQRWEFKDEAFHRFLSNPESFGFVKWPVPSANFIWVNQKLLKPLPKSMCLADLPMEKDSATFCWFELQQQGGEPIWTRQQYVTHQGW